MSWPLTREVYAHCADLDAPAKAVLLALAYHANREGMAWPALSTLHADTGLSQSTIQRALDRLEIHKYVETIPSPGRPSTFLVTPVTLTTTTPVTGTTTPVTVTTTPVTVTRGRGTGHELVKNSASAPGSLRGRAGAGTPPPPVTHQLSPGEPQWVELPNGKVERPAGWRP